MNKRYLPTRTPNVGFTCEDNWRGPGANQGRDKRLCRLEALVRMSSRQHQKPMMPNAVLSRWPYCATALCKNADDINRRFNQHRTSCAEDIQRQRFHRQ